MEADGKGPSLQLLATDLDNNLYSSWYASSGIRFSPGSQNGGNSSEEPRIVRKNSIHIYPNPVGEVLFLEINEEPETRIEVEFFTLSGTRVGGKLFHAGGGRETATLKHSIKNPGAYIVRILVKNGYHWHQESRLLIFTGRH